MFVSNNFNFKQVLKFLPLSLVLLMMLYSCIKEEEEYGLTPEEIVKNKDHFFDYTDRANHMKNVVIAALKARHQQDGFMLKSATAGEQPLWDDDLTVVTDTSTRLLIPVYSQLEGNLTSLLYFEWPFDKDSIMWTKVIAPPPVSDTTFSWDAGLLFDYFRTKLGLPTQRQVIFAEQESEEPIIQPLSVNTHVTCRIVCAYIGSGEYMFFKGCSSYCTVTYVITDETEVDFLDPSNEGSGAPGDTSPVTYMVTLTASPTNGGSVSGGGTYEANQICTISASPNDGFVFQKWANSQGEQTNVIHSFYISKNETLTAHFVASSSYSPCSQRDSMNLNSTMSMAVDSLKTDAAGLTHEMGRYTIKGPQGQSDYRVQQGGVDSVGFPLPPGYKYGWIFHSHWDDNDLIPSPLDMMTIISLLCHNHIHNTSNFVFGVVNKEGEAYGISISNLSQLQRFIVDNNLYYSMAWYVKLEEALEKAGSDAQERERRFAEKIFNSGLSIMKTNTITPTNSNWQRIEYNPVNENVVTKPCN